MPALLQYRRKPLVNKLIMPATMRVPYNTHRINPGNLLVNSRGMPVGADNSLHFGGVGKVLLIGF